jgi:hypothetical protein
MSESNIKKVNPVVEIDLGGEKVLLKFDLWALMKLEEKTGINALDGKAWLNPRAKDLASLLWAAMLHAKPAITIEEVAQKIDLQDVGVIVEKLSETFISASAPEDTTKKNEESPAETETTPAPIG